MEINYLFLDIYHINLPLFLLFQHEYINARTAKFNFIKNKTIEILSQNTIFINYMYPYNFILIVIYQN